MSRSAFAAKRLVLLVVLVAFLAWPSLGMGSVESRSEIDVSGRYFNPCGEVVDLTGTAMVLFKGFTEDETVPHGGVHLNYQGVSGFGETTGAKYQATGSLQNVVNRVGATAHTSTSMLRFVGQGQVPDLVFRATFHMTVNANGDLTSLHLVDLGPICN